MEAGQTGRGPGLSTGIGFLHIPGGLLGKEIGDEYQNE